MTELEVGSGGRHGGLPQPIEVNLADHIPTLGVVAVVMTAIAREAIVRRTYAQGTIKTEGDQAFSREADAAAARYGLTDGTGAGTRRGADCGTFSTAGNSADNRTEHRSSAHIFTCTFIGAHALFPGVVRGDSFVSCADRVTLAVDANRFEVEHDCVL